MPVSSKSSSAATSPVSAKTQFASCTSPHSTESGASTAGTCVHAPVARAGEVVGHRAAGRGPVEVGGTSRSTRRRERLRRRRRPRPAAPGAACPSVVRNAVDHVPLPLDAAVDEPAGPQVRRVRWPGPRPATRGITMNGAPSHAGSGSKRAGAVGMPDGAQRLLPVDLQRRGRTPGTARRRRAAAAGPTRARRPDGVDRGDERGVARQPDRGPGRAARRRRRRSPARARGSTARSPRGSSRRHARRTRSPPSPSRVAAAF